MSHRAIDAIMMRQGQIPLQHAIPRSVLAPFRS